MDGLVLSKSVQDANKELGTRHLLQSVKLVTTFTYRLHAGCRIYRLFIVFPLPLFLVRHRFTGSKHWLPSSLLLALSLAAAPVSTMVFIIRYGPLAIKLFSVVPQNECAKSMLSDERYKEHISAVSVTDDGKVVHGLDIGLACIPATGFLSRRILRILERDGSSLYCFLLLDNGEVMLEDWSVNKSTQTTSPTAFPFNPQRFPRRVLLSEGVNLELRLTYDPEPNRPVFKIVWYRRDHLPISPDPSQPDFRTHDAGSPKRIRFLTRSRIGRGNFGEVFSAVDVDTGRQMAVKTVKATAGVRQEVRFLSELKHVRSSREQILWSSRKIQFS